MAPAVRPAPFIPPPMHMRLPALSALLLVLAGASPLHAQDPAPVQPRVDSVAVEGNARVTAAQVVTTSGLKRPNFPSVPMSRFGGA